MYFATTFSVWYFWYGYRGHLFWDGIFYGIFLPFDGTEYAPNYSDKNFRKIQLGMSPVDVKKIVGVPIDEFKLNDRRLRMEYSCYRSTPDFCTPVDGFFHQRRITFDLAERVTDIDREYWID